jgi:beta-phosphoglucomutase
MAVIKGFFFDLDGTLVDTHEANYLAYRHSIESIKSITLGDELKAVIKSGENSDSFLSKLLPNASNEEVAAINSKKKEVYSQFLSESRLNTYLSTFLEQMSEHYVTALVTTAKKQNALAVLKEHDLEKYFSFMIFGEDVSAMKPNPEAYNLALQKTGLSANEVLVFEDSEKGIEAAEAAGINTIHIKNFL